MKLRTDIKSLVIFGIVLTTGVYSLGLSSGIASALSGSDWQAGNILDDAVLYNVNTMTAGEIQTFLSNKLPTCDTNGNQNISYYLNSSTGEVHFASSTYPANTTDTRKVFGQQFATYYYAHPYSGYFTNESLTPFICLKDYSENVSPMAADAYCAAVNGGSLSAASIISAVSAACGINPQVLIVLLQKEQGLVTDDWPWTNEYQFATGFCVYDNPNAIPPSCQGTSGFFNQVYYAARQFKKYAALPSSYNYQANQDATIAYSTDGSCGSSVVHIQTQATADLYNYTPYQPNAGALSGLTDSSPGGTAPCGSYGNRNFWWYFWNWFGSPLFSRSAVTLHTIVQPDTTPALGETVTYQVSFTNNLAADITLDAVGIVGRLGDINTGANRDMGWQGPVTIAAGQTSQVFTFTSTIKDLGTIYVWPAINYRGIYAHYNPWGAALVTHNPSLSLSSPLNSSITAPVAGQNGTLSATITNNESHSIQLDSLGIPVRFYDVYNYDTGWSTSPIVLQPGATQTVSGSILFDKPGPYTAWVSALIGNRYLSLSPVLQLSTTAPVPNFQLSYIATPDPTPALGEDVNIQFKLKNTQPVPMTLDAVGVVGRYGSPYTGPNKDFGWVGPESFAAGEEKTYSLTTNIADTQNFYAWVAINYQGRYIHYNNWGFVMTPHLPNLALSVPLVINNGSQPTLGQSTPVSVTVKNNETHPIKFSAIGIPARFYARYNYDVVWQGSGTLAASGQPQDSVALSGNITFDKPGPYTVWTSIYIQGRYITIGNVQTINM